MLDGIAVCSEISVWEKVDVEDTLKARSGAKQGIVLPVPFLGH